MRGPPRPSSKPTFCRFQNPLEVRPMPAIRVLPVESFWSSARLAIDSEAWLSVSAFQVVPPSVERQTPPLGDPRNIVLAPSAGSSRIACTAPATVPPFAGSPACTMSSAPLLGAGPCGMNVCATPADGASNRAATAIPRNCPNMTQYRSGGRAPEFIERRNVIGGRTGKAGYRVGAQLLFDCVWHFRHIGLHRAMAPA